ncbi:MAG: glutamate--tRNA ligase [Dehalococcoidia bacterium]|nr:glutamate--tRNA ligase [Dehalococcoidia bacterium]MDW8119694.1 glutamate--tRNA ligase [Chloroflexota bacterium]
MSVRVRYAPSPTGEPHVGNIRTALFNWLFARHHGGAFIVRIEDTDQERLVPGAVEAILEGLQWLGLDWDEGPTPDGKGSFGPYAPYFQSQRLPLYHQAARTLMERGWAYECFCTPQELEAMRQEQQRLRQPPGYWGKCRALTPDQREALRAQGRKSVIRFRVPRDPGEEISVHDLVRGEVRWQTALLDDFVCLKSDGFPTYHLAVVVDDHAMRMSHVLRAEEWLPSTPRHLLLYRALGWEPPLFAHLPMILGPDRSKLSKRHGATSIREYRRMGYLPEAMLNFLALLGWSLDETTEILTREDLIRHFSLERVVKAGAIFNLEKLTWMNGVYIRRLSPQDLAQRLRPFLERPHAEGGLPDSVPRPLDEAYLQRVVPLVQERLRTLVDGPALMDFFFLDEVDYDPALLVPKGMDTATTLRTLEAVQEALQRVSVWDAPHLEGVLRPLCEALGLATGQVFGMVRVATTGRTAAPPLFQTMEVLGKERTLRRLERAQRKLKELLGVPQGSPS